MKEPKPLDEVLADALAAADALEATLDEKNASYWEVERRLLPEIDAAYGELLARIAGNEAGEQAPKIGAEMPDFLMPDRRGRLVGLSELVAKGPLVLSFNRGHWCPFCHLELKALARDYAEIEAAGGAVVSIVPDTAEFSTAMSTSYALPFDVLTDLDLGYALENGLVVALGDEIKRLYLGYGLDLPRYQGNPAWLIPIPATFVVDRSGIVRARFVDPDFRRRMPITDVIEALQQSSR